jgi:hypothetical protein
MLNWVEPLIWGYAKWIQAWFGGTRRGTILIWGYASTKRLRTPGIMELNLSRMQSRKITLSYLMYNEAHSLIIFSPLLESVCLCLIVIP